MDTNETMAVITAAVLAITNLIQSVSISDLRTRVKRLEEKG
jgi:hypothetical protein